MKLAVAAAVLCFAVAAAQAVDFHNLVELPIVRSRGGRSGRITGGQEVKPHSLPYQVGLFIEVEGGTAFCGGSLISPEWVLTAAHCAEDGTSFEVVLGAHEIRSTNETTQERITTQVKIVHPGWDRNTLLNDVALLRLPYNVTLTAAIQVIRLPSKSQQDETFNGTLALESGWGKDSDAATGIAAKLNAVEKPVIDAQVCNTSYFGSIDARAHVCTSGSNGQSTCNGDSGGPLVITESDGIKTEIGTVSFGIVFGCEINWPPVFARLATYAGWISEKTGIVLRD